MASQRIPQSLLVTGPPQIGKATLARTFAMALNCQSEEKPCGQCNSCKKTLSGNHPDINILDAPQETLKIEQVRALQRDLSLRPHESPYKIVVLCDFERATSSAANALLKTLEEPPSYAVIILSAQNSSQLLPTIVSRCQIINLRPVADQVIITKLQTHWRASAEQAELIGRLAQGRLGWAVEALENPDALSLRHQYLDDLIDLSGKGHASRLAYAHSLAQKKESPAQALNLWLSWWRDVLLLNQGAKAKIVNIDYADKAQHFAQTVTLDNIIAAIKQTYTTLGNLNYNVNTRLNLEVLLLKLPYLK
ncbi:MAG TPA: DNA polymerase III subunit delta' [Chloroflexi bacterium]|nr:DNA polymerase III subunit delta' [Chloroflexota bacterium]